MIVLVTGGTGLLGRSVVDRLVEAGHRVRLLSRDPSRATAAPEVDVRRADLRDPNSVRAALHRAEVVVHCASDPRASSDVDIAGTASLLDAVRGLEVAHLVYVSIVGVDRIPLRYYRAKRQVEEMLEHQSVPWTIQRATQFHPFIEMLLSALARAPVVACPNGLRFQPIAVADVADRLVQHVHSGPIGRAPDLGGPEVLTQKELASAWLAAVGRRRLLLPVPLPGPLGRAFRSGANLCPEQATDGPTWRQYLDVVHGVSAVG